MFFGSLDEDCLELGQVIRQALQKLSVVDAGGAVLALLMNQDMRQDLRGVQPDLGQGFALLTATSPAVRQKKIAMIWMKQVTEDAMVVSVGEILLALVTGLG